MGLEAEIEVLKRQNHRLKLAMSSIIVVVVAVAWFAGVVATRARVREQQARVMAEQARAEAQAESERAQHAVERSTNAANKAYAKGVVTRKNGKKVAGHILLQCPGYLTVCFKINSSEPGSSELVAIKDVKSVVLDGPIDDVDPLWTKLQDHMTVVFGNTEEAANEGVVGMVTFDGRPVENVAVEFVPDDGGQSSAGRTNANGQFELEKGVTPGNYRVRITPEQSPTTVEGPQKKADMGKNSGGDEIELGAGR